MSRARVLDGLLAALCTVTVFAPMRVLFRESSWMQPSLVVLGTIMVLGMVGRALTSRPTVVSLVQSLGAVLVLSASHARDTLAAGLLPTTGTFARFGEFAAEAQQVMTSYAAPAPAPPSVDFLISALVALIALTVDLVAVTRRAPTLAGLPLLTTFLVSAANTGAALPWGYFVTAAVAWLLLVGRQGLDGLGRWSNVIPRLSGRPSKPERPLRAFSGVARHTAILALLAALVLPGMIPHLPTRFIAEGMARRVGGGGAGDISLSTSIDLAANLADPSTRAILRYTTTDPSPEPIRVDVVSDFHGRIRVVDHKVQASSGLGDTPRFPPGYEDPAPPKGASSTEYTMTVTSSSVASPQVAAPPRVVAANFERVPWGVDPTGVLRVSRKAPAYAVRYLTVDPSLALLEAADTYPPDGDARLPETARAGYLVTDDASGDRLRAILDSLRAPGSTQIEVAAAIQDYFRSSRFRYSLELEPRQRGDDGLPLDPVSNFLETRVGYCQQFASAMVLMAREAGIPARMAVGFLPGTPDGSGGRVVRAADAHAWPELWFDGVGWVRFEPTPGIRAAAAPEFDDGSATPSATTSAAPTDTASSSGPTAPTPSANRPQLEIDTGPVAETTWRDRLAAVPWTVWAAALTALVALSAAAAPVAAAWLRLRARRLARDDAERVEVEWQRMIADLSDVGVVAPVGATPRQTGASITAELRLAGEPREALSRVVSTLETARYARPGSDMGDVDRVAEDADTVLGAARRHQRRRDVWRARLFPAATLRRWRQVTRAGRGRHSG